MGNGSFQMKEESFICPDRRRSKEMQLRLRPVKDQNGQQVALLQLSSAGRPGEAKVNNTTIAAVSRLKFPLPIFAVQNFFQNASHPED